MQVAITREQPSRTICTMQARREIHAFDCSVRNTLRNLTILICCCIVPCYYAPPFAGLCSVNRLTRKFAVSLRRCLAVFSCAITLLLGLSILLPTPVRASEGFQPVSPEELKMTSEPKAPGAPAIILFRQLDRYDMGQAPHEYNYFRIKILTEEGRKYADVEIPFFTGFAGTINNIRARTIKPDGTIVEFEGGAYDKSLVKAKGLRIMAKTFTLPAVEIGSVLEYYYTIDLHDHRIYSSQWILSNDLFTKHAEFSLLPYANTNDVDNFNIRWSWQDLPPGTEPPKQGTDRVVRMLANDIPAFQVEDFMAPINELKARVDFIYVAGYPEKEDAQFWKNVGKQLNSEVESFVGKKGAMEQAVAQIVSPNDSPDVKLQKIYARVQQLHNTSYEVRKTEQQQKRESEKPVLKVEEVWKNGRGSGTQLTWLFLALARAAGFEAYGVMVSDRSNYFFHPYIRDAHRLDANVVLVKVDGKDLFFDPGAAFTPFGLLKWPETGVQGLRLDKDGGSWVRTSLPEPSASRIERKADLTLSDSGDLEGKLTVTFSGLEALKRRLEERNQDETERKKFIEDEAKEYIPAASEVDLTNQPDWISSAPSLVAEFKVKIPGWVSGAGRRGLLPVGIFTASEKHVFDRVQRVHPIYFEFPFEKLDDVSIAMPLGWQIAGLPAAQNNDGKVVAYTSSAVNDKRTLHLTRKLSVDLMLLDVKYYDSLRQFFQEVRKGDEAQVVLQPIGTSSSK